MPTQSSSKSWTVRCQVHIPSINSSQPVFNETIPLPSLADLMATPISSLYILTGLRVALTRPRRRASITEVRRLNGLTIKEVYAWWNCDATERDHKGRSVRRMTKIDNKNFGEVLMGLKVAEPGRSNCLVVYCELPRVVRQGELPGSSRGR